MKQNKFEYLYVLQGRYGSSYGWEDLTASKKNAEGLKEIRQNKKDYIENEGTGEYRIISRRVKTGA